MRIFSASAGFIVFALLSPVSHSANVNENQPDSVSDSGVETFHLTCPDSPKETTLDMQNCLDDKKAKVEWVRNKYLTAIKQRMEESSGEDAAHNSRLKAALEKENLAWKLLQATAANAMYTDYEEGTIRGIMAANREITLTEMQIHEQWQTWLTYPDSTPAVLPEPKFIDPDNH